MMADNATAKLMAELWARIAAAQTDGDKAEYLFLCRVQHVLWQYEAVTPRAPEYLPCQSCETTGRHAKPYQRPDGRLTNIQVLCARCQGSGRTANPHPTVAWPEIKAEM